MSDDESQSLARRRPVNADAHAAYLEARFWWNKRTKVAFEKAVELHDRALQLDPEFALAHAGKAETYVLMSLYSHAPNEVMPADQLSSIR